jgi:uncharacterized C2H2 Zn-finger protein
MSENQASQIQEQKQEEKKEEEKTIYKCPVCGREFTTRAGMYYHLKKVHPQYYEQNMKRKELKTNDEELKVEIENETKTKKSRKVKEKGERLDFSKTNLIIIGIVGAIAVLVLFLFKRNGKTENNQQKAEPIKKPIESLNDLVKPPI